jgi:hypothetical protein
MKALAVISRKIPVETARKNITDAGLLLHKEYTNLDNTFLVEGDEGAMKALEGLLALEPQTTNFSLQLAPWHLRRLVTKSLPLREDYDPLYSGKDVVVYVVDSGIDTTHPEFLGAKVVNLWSVVPNDFGDEVGHGTAMASLVNGVTLGVAKEATVANVKITDTSYATTMSDILDAFDAILAHSEGATTTNIVNCSWTVPKSYLLDLKVAEVMDKGLLVVAAAGNTGEDANLFSPGGVDRVVTVGATDEYDRMVSFADKQSFVDPNGHMSNFGEEVDLAAPGIDVLVAKTDGTIVPACGTSISSAIVAGAAALFSQKAGKIAADELKEMMFGTALSNLVFRDWKVYGNIANRLLHVENSYYRSVWITPAGLLAKVKSDAGIVEIPLKYDDDVVSVTSPLFASLPPFITIGDKKLILDTKNLPHSAPVGYQFILECKVASGQEYSRGFSIQFYQNDATELTDQTEEYSYEVADEGTGDYTPYVKYALFILYQTFKP